MSAGIKQIAKPDKFNEKAFQQEIIVEMSKVGRDIRVDYEKTTKKWKRKPKFVVTAMIRPRLIKVMVGTDNEIYMYVDFGTKKHIIRPRKRRVLRWLGKGYSGKGRPKGSDYIFAAYVNHPGFKGYKHTDRMIKKWRKLFPRRMEKALARGIRASGHQMT